MKKTLSITGSLVLVLMVGVMVAGCQAQPTPTPPSGGETGGGTTGGQSTEAATEAPTQTSGGTVVGGGLLDPALADEGSAAINGQLYDTLVFANGDSITPGLALKWTISEDNLSYTFELRRNATFHDGTPVNADAVIANFTRWFDAADPLHGTGAYSAWVSTFGGFKGETAADGKPKSTFDGIEKIDDFTVLIHLNVPDPDLLPKLANGAFAIASPAAINDKFGSKDGVDGGSGPYKVGEWGDTKITLVPFDGYWNGAPEGNQEFEIK